MNDQLQVVAPEWGSHEEDVRDLTAKVFRSSGNYWDSFMYSRQGGYFENSHYRPEYSRIGILDGETVTHVGVFEYVMRIGRARVRVAGIGAVATHGEHRRKGLMSRTMQACLQDLKEHGFDFSILFGIRNFYDKFGYVNAWSDTVYTILAQDLPLSDCKVRGLRKYNLSKHDEHDALYNRENRQMTGSAVRPTYRLCELMPGKTGYRWENTKNELSGYVILIRKEEEIHVYEFAGEPEEIFQVLVRLSRRWACRKIRFLHGVFYNSKLARQLRQGRCERMTLFSKYGGAMIRTIKLRSALTKMEVELSYRLKHSYLANYKGSLWVSDQRENVLLEISASKVRVSDKKPRSAKHRIKGGEEVAQLLIGTDEPEETCAFGKIKLSREAQTLVPVLFPRQYPTHVPWDYY